MTEARIFYCRDAWHLARRAVIEIAAHANQAVAARGAFTISLAGGSTPRSTYALLAADEGIPWEHMTLVYGDERCVPPDDPRSNYRMVRAALLDPLGERAPRVLRIEGELAAEEAARRYDASLRDVGTIDLALLGLGADGHTASLFPGSPLLTHDGPELAAVAWSEETQTHRVTLTLRALRAARARVFMVSGEQKATVVAAALAQSSQLPAALVGPATWLVAPPPDDA